MKPISGCHKAGVTSSYNARLGLLSGRFAAVMPSDPEDPNKSWVRDLSSWASGSLEGLQNPANFDDV